MSSSAAISASVAQNLAIVSIFGKSMIFSVPRRLTKTATARSSRGLSQSPRYREDHRLAEDRNNRQILRDRSRNGRRARHQPGDLEGVQAPLPRAAGDDRSR